MKTTENLPGNRRIWVILGAAAAFGIVIAASLAVNSQTPTIASPTNTAPILSTTDPTIVTQLRDLPNATPISADEDAFLIEFRAEIIACSDFSSARRDQMLQHVAWLRDPTVIPPDVAFALTMGGSSISGGLVHILGMATTQTPC